MNAISVGIGVMAKAPVAGFCKTRLCPPLSSSAAARLYAALLADTLASVDNAAPRRRYLFAAPEHDGVAHLGRMFPWPIVAQSGVSLGARIESAISHVLDDGNAACLLLGSDAPLIPLQGALDACAWLVDGDPSKRALFGPADDGGYYLVGVARRIPALFENIPWSTSEVLAATRARARDGGITLAELPEAADVDDAASLERFIRTLRQTGAAPSSRHVLAELGLL